MPNTPRTKLIVYCITLGCLTAGIVCFTLIRVFSRPEITSLVTEMRADSPAYQYVNPLIYLRTDKSLFSSEFKPLLDSVNAEISSDLGMHSADDISVYFRDLNSGHWTGVNEKDKYEPSSMLKVITVMATMHLAEDGQLSFLDKLPYKPDEAGQYYKPNDGIAAGDYSIQDLMKYAIGYSDNGANEALLNDPRINGEFIDTYKLFRLPEASTTGSDFMSAASYSVIWRTLYNATYLSADSSEQILHLLTLTTFDKGIVAALPTDIQVAHKFGENTLLAPDGSVTDHELHDCGIVYYPGHPYLLCIMTKGQAFPGLEKIISDVSSIAYKYVVSAYPASKQ